MSKKEIKAPAAGKKEAAKTSPKMSPGDCPSTQESLFKIQGLKGKALCTRCGNPAHDHDADTVKTGKAQSAQTFAEASSKPVTVPMLEREFGINATFQPPEDIDPASTQK